MKHSLKVLASGQPGSYQDSRYIAQLFVTDQEGRAFPISEQEAKIALEQMPASGFLNREKKDALWYQSYLEYFKAVEPIDEGLSARWEFKVVTPFVD